MGQHEQSSSIYGGKNAFILQLSVEKLPIQGIC